MIEVFLYVFFMIIIVEMIEVFLYVFFMIIVVNKISNKIELIAYNKN